MSAEDVMRCQLCGTPVRVVSSGEGTSSYQPVSTEYAKLFAAKARLARLERANEAATRELARASDVRTSLIGIIGNAMLILQDALAATEEGAEE